MKDDEDYICSIDELDALDAEFSNPYLAQPAAAMALIARLLAAPAQLAPSGGMEQLNELILKELPALAGQGGAAGMKFAHAMAALLHSVQELAQFPDLANKLVVGVGGSFSAGKSRFLNTLLGVDLLPEDLGATTALPTYLVQGASAIQALNRMQRKIALDYPALQALTHGFHRQYQADTGEQLGLAALIRLLVIEDPAMPWQHLALLDTPGYDKPDSTLDALTDEAIAREQLQQADHIVWLINARNGTLRESDIRFLQSLLPARPVFFVLTQCDLQSPTAIATILHRVEQAAEASGITVAGAMAWAAPLGQRQGTREHGTDIRQWLNSLNLQPKLTDKRRTAAQEMSALIAILQAQFATAVDELKILNAFWPVSEGLPDEQLAGFRQLLRGRRAEQRHRSDLLGQLEAFGSRLDRVLGDVMASMALADARDDETIERQFQDAMRELRLRGADERSGRLVERLLEVAGHGHLEACCTVAEFYRLGTGVQADAGLAFAWYQRAAQAGVAQAQFALADFYRTGQGVSTDIEMALHWYNEAAEQEHVAAQLELYACYRNGVQGEADLERAVSWLRRAAQERQDGSASPAAKYELGNCYLNGVGVVASRRQASNWYLAAAKLGHAAAQCEIGHAYQCESSSPADDEMAAHWFRQAAAQDHAEAQVCLAHCYLQGKGLPKNRSHAATWYRRAVQLGEASGSTGLGNCSVAAGDWADAVDHYRRAAKAGDAEAQYRLGECYLAGNGVRKNRTIAADWFALAAEQDYQAPYPLELDAE